MNLRTKKVTINDIRESLYDAHLDTEYREALAHAIMELEYVSDSPLNLYFGTEEQKKELEIADTKNLDYNQISEIIHLIMYEMRDDFQYGSFKPVADKYINISKELEKQNSKIDNINYEYKKTICKVESCAVMYELICLVSKTLKKNNMHDESRKMIERATSSYSYNEAFDIIQEYVDIVKEREKEEEFE